ncbi:MAG: tryptophan--tRNA ligase [Planctomycetota bacterium]
MPGVKRLLSGIRPNGALHLGHYVGALRPWVSYQETHECYFMVADVQLLATRREPDPAMAGHVRDVVLDWLAVGLDPRHASFVLQSRMPELAELTVYLQSLVRTGELRNNPTTREEARAWGKGNFGDGVSDVEFGFLGYPVSQAADILAFTTSPPAEDDELIVPVGFDQVPHVEFAAEVGRRFNHLYGDTFLLPQPRTSHVPRLPGIDGGSKMGKSRRNAILLKDPADIVTSKIRSMFTDPLRVRREDPGHPDACPCFLFRRAFGGSQADLPARREQCLLAETDCEDCKTDLAAEVQAVLAPLQERRAAYAEQPDLVAGILEEGTDRARALARRTLARVREAIGLAYPDLLRKSS